MATIKIETYYDVGCDICGRHWSTDFNHGMERNIVNIKVAVKKEGWANDGSRNICPICREVEKE